MILELQKITWFPIFIPLAAALIIALVSAFTKGEGSLFAKIFSIAALLVSIFLAWHNWLDGRSQNLLVLILAYISVVMVIFLTLPCGPLAVEHYILLLLSAFGMGCIISSELLIILLGIVMILLSTSSLAGPSGFKYYLMSSFALVFFLIGLAFIFGSAGSMNLETLGSRLPEITAGSGRYFSLLGIAMLLIGSSFLIAVVPFHTWVPYLCNEESFLAIRLVLFYIFLKMSLAIFQSAGGLWIYVVSVMAIVTMTFANLAAISQTNIRRLLAYTSISHAGYALVAFPTIASDPKGTFSSVIFYLVTYMLVMSGAFSVVAALEGAGGGQIEMDNLAGLSRRRPFLAAVFSLFLISFIGIPPAMGFFAKYYIFMTAIKGGFFWVVVAALINIVLSVYIYLRPIMVMYFYEDKNPSFEAEPLHPAIIAILTITALAVIYFGLFPSLLLVIIGQGV